jgi:acyl-coenzyme A thioesterase PaaI-like protein
LHDSITRSANIAVSRIGTAAPFHLAREQFISEIAPRPTLMKAIQDYYPDELAHCFGCGRLNEHGHHLRSFWNGVTSEARFTPQPFHTALPGFVSGGLLASLVDCHGTGTAAAAAYAAEGREMDTLPGHRFVTASLRVDYLRPTPLGPELLLRGKVRSVAGRKVVVEITVVVGNETTVRGEVVAVEMPDSMRTKTP